MSLFYVSMDGVSAEMLEMLGYYLLSEDPSFKVYYHKGDEIIVDKSDPFIYVDVVNDASYFGSDILSIDRDD